MFRRAALAAAVTAGLLATGGCMPITTYSGFQAIEVNPADVKPGEDTKSTVMGKLGSPSVTSTFDPNVWFYMSQVTDRVAFYQPRVAKRALVHRRREQAAHAHLPSPSRNATSFMKRTSSPLASHGASAATAPSMSESGSISALA